MRAEGTLKIKENTVTKATPTKNSCNFYITVGRKIEIKPFAHKSIEFRNDTFRICSFSFTENIVEKAYQHNFKQIGNWKSIQSQF